MYVACDGNLHEEKAFHVCCLHREAISVLFLVDALISVTLKRFYGEFGISIIMMNRDSNSARSLSTS